MTHAVEVPESPVPVNISPVLATARQNLLDWSSKRRADLVAACWRAGLQNVAELSRLAGVERSTIYVDLALHGIHVARERKIKAQIPPGTVFVRRPWHHENYIGEFTERDRVMIVFKAFTGHEKRPALPDSWGQWDSETYEAARHEVNQAEGLWMREKLITVIRHDATQLQVAWSALLEAWTALQAAYTTATTDGSLSWRVAVATLLTAQRMAVAAAESWDRLYEDHQHGLNEVTYHYEIRQDAYNEVEQRDGVKVNEWSDVPGLPRDISEKHWQSSYGGTDLVHDYITPVMKTAVDEQNEHIREISKLASIGGDQR
jgi:hypothetical protein